MKFYVVNKRVCHWPDWPIQGFHVCMFHGEALRGGKPTYHPKGPRSPILGTGPRVPLEITKNAYKLADLFQPSGYFVISERLRNALSKFNNLEFLEVRFTKLFSLAYAPNDFSFTRKYPRWSDAERVIEKIPDDPELHVLCGRYFELITVRHDDATKEFPGAPEYSIAVPESVYREPMVATISAEMLETYPIIFHTHGIIVSANAMAVLRPCIDENYFEIVEASLEKK